MNRKLFCRIKSIVLTSSWTAFGCFRMFWTARFCDFKFNCEFQLTKRFDWKVFANTICNGFSLIHVLWIRKGTYVEDKRRGYPTGLSSSVSTRHTEFRDCESRSDAFSLSTCLLGIVGDYTIFSRYDCWTVHSRFIRWTSLNEPL